VAGAGGPVAVPLLILLAVTAVASAFLGQASDAVIIGMILAASVGLGFFNEYKAAKTAEALHSSIHHRGAGHLNLSSPAADPHLYESDVANAIGRSRPGLR
jgi:magnesium-transporting ATPase (P-type)